jgi:cytochrome c-type biogenesis protein CcmH
VSRRLALVGIVLAAVLVMPSVARSEGPGTAAGLEAELVCPTCKTTLDQSDAPVARRMKAIIRQRLAEGKTGDEIKAELVDQFGAGVLAEPPKSGFDLLAWLLPLGILGVGIVGVAVIAWSWRDARRDAEPQAALEPELARRVDDALERFDA